MLPLGSSAILRAALATDVVHDSEPLILIGGTVVNGSTWQVASQPSPSIVLPSSQFSPRLNCTRPSPHTSIKQLWPQPSSSAVLPSSHCSPGSTWLSPQIVTASETVPTLELSAPSETW